MKDIKWVSLIIYVYAHQNKRAVPKYLDCV